MAPVARACRQGGPEAPPQHRYAVQAGGSRSGPRIGQGEWTPTTSGSGGPDGLPGSAIRRSTLTSVGEPPVHPSVAPEAHRLRNRGRMRQPVARLDTRQIARRVTCNDARRVSWIRNRAVAGSATLNWRKSAALIRPPHSSWRFARSGRGGRTTMAPCMSACRRNG